MNPRHAAGVGLVAVAGVVAVFGFTHYHTLANRSVSPIANQALTAAGGVSANTSIDTSTNNSLAGGQGNLSASANSPKGDAGGDTGDANRSSNSKSGSAATTSRTSRTSSQSGASGASGGVSAARGSSAAGASASSGVSTAKGSTSSKQGNASSTSSQSSGKSSTKSSTSSTSTGPSSSPPPASLGTFTIVVSKDKGAEVLAKKAETIHSGESLMDYMKQDFQIQTVYNGQFITAIDGIKSLWTGVPVSERQPIDWFLYVNGQEAPVGADSIMPQAGDVDTWDYHQWNPSTGRG